METNDKFIERCRKEYATGTTNFMVSWPRRHGKPFIVGLFKMFKESLRRLEEAGVEIADLKERLGMPDCEECQGKGYVSVNYKCECRKEISNRNLSTLQQGEASSTVCEKDQNVGLSANDCDVCGGDGYTRVEYLTCKCLSPLIDEGKCKNDSTTQVENE